MNTGIYNQLGGMCKVKDREILFSDTFIQRQGIGLLLIRFIEN